MRTGGKLKVKVARSKEALPERHAGGKVAATGSGGQLAAAAAAGADTQVLSDEEMAWRLHQELNATSPMLRTRSRKAPDFFGGGAQQQKSSGERLGAASDSLEGPAGKARGGGGGKTLSVNKVEAVEGSPQGPVSSGACSGEEVEEQERELAQPQEQAQQGSAMDTEQAAAEERDAGGLPEQPAPAKGEGDPEDMDAEQGDTQRAACSPRAAAGAGAGGGSGDGPHGSSAPSSAARGTTSSFHGGSRGDTSSADEPAAAGAGAGADAAQQRRRHKTPKAAAAAAAAAEQRQAAAAPAPKVPRAKGRQLKIPKLPMVRQVDGRWYRARLLQDLGDKVSLEFTGFESQFPPIWLPRNSDRIWRGSYKGKDWKHLGGGSWEPKTKSGGRRGKGGLKRKRSDRAHSDDVGHSSGGGPAHSHEGGDSEQEHSEDEEMFDEVVESGRGPAEEEEEEAEGEKPSLKAEPEAHTRGAGRAAEQAGGRVKEEAEEEEEEQQQQQQQVGGAGAEGAQQRPAKKARRSGGRKRLDPIVREALLAAGQGEDSEDNAAHQSAWQRQFRLAAQAHEASVMAEAQALEAAAGAAQQPHHTPTPETPVTRLGKRMSLTPAGAFAPLSPRAAAAAAAAIEEAASPRHRQQQEGSDRGGGGGEALMGPRGGRQRAQQHQHGAALSVASPRAAAAAAAQAGSMDGGAADGREPGSDVAPLSPRRHRHRGGSERERDGPSSHHHQHRRRHAKAVAAATEERGEEEEGDGEEEGGGDSGGGSGGGQEGRARRAARRQHRAAAEPAEQGDSDSGEHAADDTGSESQEEARPKARPRRQPRKAAIFKDSDFAFGEEADEAVAEQDGAGGMVTGVDSAGTQDAAEQPAQPARRRRKPLVSSPAPTDVGLPLPAGRGPGSALPAPLAALDVALPPPPPPSQQPAAAGSEGAEVLPVDVAAAMAGPLPADGGKEDGGAAAEPMALGGEDGPEDEEEAAAVAALADLPSPRAALAGLAHFRPSAAAAQQQYRAVAAAAAEEALVLEEEEEEEEAAGVEGGEDDEDDDYAPPARRREGADGLAPGALRKRSPTLPLALDHVRSGRVHKALHAAAAPLSRHYSLTSADRQHSSSGRRGGFGAGGHHRLGRQGGAEAEHHSHHHSHHHHYHHRRINGAAERSVALGLAGSLDGIAVAQGMFSTILSALKKCSLDDVVLGAGTGGLNGYGPMRRGGSKGGAGALGAMVHAGQERAFGAGAVAGGKHLHLFSSAWSHRKWHSKDSGEPHPSILSIQPDLFSKAYGGSNGTTSPASLFSLALPTAAASRPLLHCPTPKPPLPLFC